MFGAMNDAISDGLFSALDISQTDDILVAIDTDVCMRISFFHKDRSAGHQVPSFVIYSMT